MVRVQRANVVLDIEDDDSLIQKYLDKGYDVLDKHGKVVKRAMPFEVGALQALVTEHERTIEKLKAELEESKAELEELKSKTVETEKPKRSRTKKAEE